MIQFIILLAIIIFAYYFISGKANKVKPPSEAIIFDPELLEKNVLFYRKLKIEEKRQFEKDIKDFLQDVRITGVDTNVAIMDKLFIASAAIIPIFHFKKWKYHNLKEVLLYSDAINMNFQSTGSESRDILGMVGAGNLEGKMLLSKHALQQGFYNSTDKSNTAIHEFVHLIDKSDGDTDGIPNILLDKQYVLPWINLIQEQIQQIAKSKSDINPYASMNKAEFLAVSAEYFFERPELLKDKHPELHEILRGMFEHGSKE